MNTICDGENLFNGKYFQNIFLEQNINILFREYEFLLIFVWRSADGVRRMRAAWLTEELLSKLAYQELGLLPGLFPQLPPNEAVSIVLEKHNTIFDKCFYNAKEALKFLSIDSANSKSMKELKAVLIKKILEA
jgi:hypothetical protein